MTERRRVRNLKGLGKYQVSESGEFKVLEENFKRLSSTQKYFLEALHGLFGDDPDKRYYKGHDNSIEVMSEFTYHYLSSLEGRTSKLDIDIFENPNSGVKHVVLFWFSAPVIDKISGIQILRGEQYKGLYEEVIFLKCSFEQLFLEEDVRKGVYGEDFNPQEFILSKKGYRKLREWLMRAVEKDGWNFYLKIKDGKN